MINSIGRDKRPKSKFASKYSDRIESIKNTDKNVKQKRKIHEEKMKQRRRIMEENKAKQREKMLETLNKSKFKN